MKYLRIFIFLMLAVSLNACWSAEQTKVDVDKQNNTNDQNTNDQNTNDQNEFETIKERLKEQSENPDGRDSDDKKDKLETDTKLRPNDGTLSPTETLKELDAATIAKDAERVKKVITKSSVNYFENEAKKRGMTFKQLVEQPSQMPTVETPEMRNEIIDGDKATVEAKNRFLGTFDKYPLVKEDGVWKVAYDIYLKQKLEEINKVTKP